MILGIQLLAILFLLVMMYFTYHSFRKGSYGVRSFALWMAIWVAALILIIFPATIYGVMEALDIERTADFFVLAGFAFLTTIIFYLYTVVKKNEERIETLVRQQALEKAKKKK